MKKLVVALAILACASSAQAAPIVINFDSLSNGEVITNQYASSGVTFSSTAGFVNYVTTQSAYNGTKPNFLCTGPVGSSISCTAETIVEFSAPVSGLTFQGLGIDYTSSDVAHIGVFQNGSLTATVIVPGAGQGLDPYLVNLSAYAGITKIRIYSITDGAGIGWDTFTFEQGTTVPEPGSSLLLLGMGIVGLRAWRRR
jgi:hypothetical protein